MTEAVDLSPGEATEAVDLSPGEATDLIDVLVSDHRRVETLFAELERGEPDSGHRRDVLDVVIAELVRHSTAEELYLYPTVRELLPDGDRIADHELRQHADTKRLMDAADVAALIAAVRTHIEEQERDVLRRLRQVCPPDRLEELGHRVEAAKRIAPTRPHPNAPANRVGAAGTGLVDRVRDAITNRPTQISDL
jgi:hemerythrin superfamily protein